MSSFGKRSGASTSFPSSARKRILKRAARNLRYTGTTSSVGRAQNVLLAARRRRNAVTGGFVGTELKYFDTLKAVTNLTGPTDTTTFLFNPGTGGDCLNCPAQGSTALQRDGKKIRMKSLYIKGVVVRNFVEALAAPFPPVSVYVAAVLDRQTNAAAASSNVIWKQAPGGASAAFNCMLSRDLENGERFKILRDQVFDMNLPSLGYAQADAHSTNGLMRHFTWFIPLNGLPAYFNIGTTAAIANMVRNSISFYAVQNYVPATGAQAEVAYISRLRFIG